METECLICHGDLMQWWRAQNLVLEGVLAQEKHFFASLKNDFIAYRLSLRP